LHVQNLESTPGKARRPFHPERFVTALNFDDGILAGVMRSKGYCWIATHHDEAFRWSQAGVSIKMDQDGPWMCTIDESEWPEDEATRDWIRGTMEKPWGDRRQELVFIGSEMEEVVLRSRLEECLLTDDELRLTPAHWSLWDCPLPIPSIEEIMAEPSDAE
jgi:G3E family GTPase